jgi:hypothetical protein
MSEEAVELSEEFQESVQEALQVQAVCQDGAADLAALSE